MKLSDIMSLRGGTDQEIRKWHVREEETTAVLYAIMRETGAVRAVMDASWDFPLCSIFVVAEKQE